MTIIFESPRDLLGKEGTILGPSAWLTVDQARIDAFADCTGDHQWIHVDPARAKDGPFGTTIAHGYLTLSLSNLMMPEMIDVRRVANGLNVGTNRLRFLNPVRCGSRIRGVGEILTVEEVASGAAIQCVIRVTVEIEGEEKPACVVEAITRYFPED
ncbi:MaoC family dehydratase [Sphingobium sp.]|uniref:MaoC family dehydratase n=1 Tax=Sphingobium sp. TaxID=1912891 RepID=UPI002CD40F50|nr:MaoC family dehydratase [Sphingobium sp.]HUD91832.1 MaoC family dehydratase [Sphingobium sp.]